ncbi:MAG TPA: zinc-ribbon domain-containing protein [Aggregicoccus sp.]|nr:zinc-ribbon domain-containing protein [Aggregicoccus sp.]
MGRVKQDAVQIACPQCAMQYVLDERLLPPGGAPVQCTRCSHVFTAVPGGTQRPPTQAFGAVTPAEGSSAAGRASTQVFGTGRPQGAPARTSTQVFGAGAAAPAERRAPSEARSTQVFGSPAPRASTQVFGSSPGAEPPPPRASTQVFGSTPGTQPPRASAQVFGSGEPGAQPPRASTQVFGSGPAAEPGAQPPRASTQMFGSTPASGTPAPAPRASTQVFGSVAAPAPGQAPGAGSEAPARATTQVFGSSAAEPPAPRTSTQMFGAPAQPPAAPGGPEAPRASTQQFGVPELLRGSAQGPSAAASSGEAGAPGLQRVELPPELLSERGARVAAEPRRMPASQPLRTRAGLWLGLLAALIAVLAFLAWRTVHRRSSAFPLEAVSARDSASALLRRDDARSRQQAIASLQQVVQAHPGFVEAQAELVVALALELDDLRFERAQHQLQQRRARRERESLESARSPEGWQQRAEQLRLTEATHREASALLTRREEAAATRAEAARRELLQAVPEEEAAPSERLARARAHALLVAVNGAPGAPALLEALRASGDPQGWDVIAQAEHALNAAGTSPEVRAAAASALEALRRRDAAFLRAYVLGARLALASGEGSSAAALADMALALNPAHDGALALQAMAREGRASASPAD